MSYSKNREILKGVRIKIGLIIIHWNWKPHATNNKADIAKFLYHLILYNK